MFYIDTKVFILAENCYNSKNRHFCIQRSNLLEEIGKLIRRKRKELGYSKEEFCGLANISPRTLYKIEHNKSKGVRFETIEHLLNLIGYKIEIKEK